MKMELNEALVKLKNAGLIVEGDVSADNIRRSLLKSFKDYGWNKNEDQYSFEINVSPEEVKVQAKAYFDWGQREDVKDSPVDFIWDMQRNECGIAEEGERGPYLSEDEECSTVEEFGRYINRQLNRNYI